MPSERQLIEKIQSHVSRLVQAVADAQFWHERWIEQFEAKHRANAARIEAEHQARMGEAKSTYDSALAQAKSDAKDVTKAAGLFSVPWEDLLWNSWQPTSDIKVGNFARIGTLTSVGTWDRFEQPALLPFIGRRNLLLKTPIASKATAVNVIQSLGLRLVANIPPGKLRFTFIDPIGLGQNVTPFMHLADYDDALVTSKAWTEPQHIEQRLANLTENMENIIQKYLRNQYATIEDYNAQAGEVAEPYHILVVLDFPANFSDVAARRLVSIAQNGPRCGVYTIVLVDTTAKLPYEFNLASLEQFATVIAWDDSQNRFVWQDPVFKECLLSLDKPPDTELFNRIVNLVGQSAKDASKVEVPFERIAPAPATWWNGEYDSRKGLRSPLGPSGARKIQYLDLGTGTAQHALVAGKTGSGKSTLLHVLITCLALGYSPDEIELYLIDFKKGVEFKTYATHQLPHARVIAIESEREFGLSVLQGLDAELKRRGDLFRSKGVDGLADYRSKTLQRMPRILLLVDEFQEFFTEDDPIASQSSQILDRLVRQGRAFGIHVLLGSQTLAGAYSLARSTIDQMAVRIALQCSEADSRLILADDNPAARLLSRPGEAIYNAANGLVEGNNRFQVAWLSDDKRDDYLDKIQAMAEQSHYSPPRPQIIFEGNAPAEVEKNSLLRDLLDSPSWPAPAKSVRAWLGDPVAIRDPMAANFRPQNGNNVLIVGQNDETALGTMLVALLSLAAQIEPSPDGELPFYALDFGNTDASYADVLANLQAALPKVVQVGRRRQLQDILSALAIEVQRRLGNDGASGAPKYLFIYGLQRARDLRPDESLGFSSYGDDKPAAPSLAQQFATILREGPDVGVHTIVWCDTLTNLNRSLERGLLREFALRVVFQMSAEDSSNLIDTPAASKLGAHRALFYNEEEGRLDKFRPYGLPSKQWMELAISQLRQKSE